MPTPVAKSGAFDGANRQAAAIVLRRLDLAPAGGLMWWWARIVQGQATMAEFKESRDERRDR